MSETPNTPMTLEGRFPMVRDLANGWWVFVLRGAVAILFGILILMNPGIGLAFVLGILAAWMAIDGVGTLYHAFKGTAGKTGFWFWLDGIISVLAAGIVLFNPGLASLTLVFIVGIWTILTGAIRLVMAFRMGSILLGILGAIAVFFGAWIIIQPGAGLLAIIWIVAFEALLMGGMLLAFGFRLRRIANDPHGPEAQAA